MYPVCHDAKLTLLYVRSRYFASRPDVFGPRDGGAGASASGPSAGAAGAAVHRALASNPEATSKLFSAGLKHGVPKSSPYSAAVSPVPPATVCDSPAPPGSGLGS